MSTMKQFTKKVESVKGDRKAVSALLAETRQTFIDRLGLPKANVNNGYKFQKAVDPKALELVIEAKMQFEIIVEITGRGRDILRKMNRNLINADRASVFAQIERDAKKASKPEVTEEVKAV